MTRATLIGSVLTLALYTITLVAGIHIGQHNASHHPSCDLRNTAARAASIEWRKPR